MQPRTVTLSLFLALALLAPQRAAAEPSAAEPESRPVASMRLLGTTYCFAWAPPEATCDVRLSHPNVSRVLGFNVCREPVPDGAVCHLRLPLERPEATARAGEGIVLPLAGRNLCIGAVSPDQECHLRLGPATPASDRTEHASL